MKKVLLITILAFFIGRLHAQNLQEANSQNKSTTSINVDSPVPVPDIALPEIQPVPIVSEFKSVDYSNLNVNGVDVKVVKKNI